MDHLDSLHWNNGHLSFIDENIFVANNVQITFGSGYRYKRRKFQHKESDEEMDRQAIEIQFRRLQALIGGRADIYNNRGRNDKKIFPNVYEALFLKRIGFKSKPKDWIKL